MGKVTAAIEEGIPKPRIYGGWPGSGYAELYAEPKIDGYRMHAVIDSAGAVTVRSRHHAEPYASNLRHVAEQIATLGLRDCMLDGEIVADDFGSTAVVRRKTLRPEDTEALARVRFYAFDLVPLDGLVRDADSGRLVCPVPLRERRQMLTDAFAGRSLPNVTTTAIVRLHCSGHVRSYAAAMVAAGYEGVVVKDPDSPYTFGGRDGSWKVKPFESVDAVIVGYVEGTGRNDGMLGAFVVRDATGSEFRVSSGIHSQLRRECWLAREELLGTVIEAKVQAGSRARHPSFSRFRPDRVAA